MLASLAVLLVAASAACGQSISQQVSAFNNASIVPNIIPTFQPSGYFRFDWDNETNVIAGTQLPPARLQRPPAIFFNGTANATYFLITLDPDAPRPQAPNLSDIIHWSVMDLKATGDSQQLERGTEVARYGGPAPPAGSDPHRYISLLYVQPANFTLPAAVQNLPTSFSGGRLNFNFTQFLAVAGLGSPVGGNFILSANDNSTAPSGASYFNSATIGASSRASTSAAAMITSTMGGSASRSASAGGPTASVTAVAGDASRLGPGIALAILLAACLVV